MTFDSSDLIQNFTCTTLCYVLFVLHLNINPAPLYLLRNLLRWSMIYINTIINACCNSIYLYGLYTSGVIKHLLPSGLNTRLEREMRKRDEKTTANCVIQLGLSADFFFETMDCIVLYCCCCCCCSYILQIVNSFALVTWTVTNDKTPKVGYNTLHVLYPTTKQKLKQKEWAFKVASRTPSMGPWKWYTENNIEI